MFGLAVKTGFSYAGEFSEINFMYYPYLPAVDDIKLDPDDKCTLWVIIIIIIIIIININININIIIIKIIIIVEK